MKKGDKIVEHNILLYTENLKALVKGHLEYVKLESSDPEKIYTIPIK